MAPQLAWIGLGNMGRGMVKNLVEKGNLANPLILHNRTRTRADDLSSQLGTSKTTVASTLSEAITPADIIFTCLGDDAAITSTITTITQTPNLNIKNKLFIDCSTVHPNTTTSLNTTLTEAGAHFIASPVFGAPAMAASGQLTFVLAGPAAAVDRVRPYTVGVMARDVLDFSGQEPQKASLMKVLGNTLILQMVESLAEGHVVAETSGLGSSNLHAFVGKMFGAGPYSAYSNRMMQGDYLREEPLFGVDLARKDARHALEIAGSGGAKMKAVEVADQHLKVVQDHMGARGDLAGIYGAVRAESGLKFEV